MRTPKLSRPLSLAASLSAALLLVSQAQSDEIVYLEIFPNGTGGNIPVTASNWQYNTGPTGSVFARDISNNNGAVAQPPVNSNPSTTTSSGYPFLAASDGDRALFWTNEYTIDGDEYALTRFRWHSFGDGGGGTDANDIRLAVQVNGGTWYATDQSDAPMGGVSNNWLERDLDLTTATWQELSFTPGSSLGLTGPTGQSLPLRPDITAFGVFKPNFTTTFRPDNFTLFADEPPPLPLTPEPATLLLWGAGLAGVVAGVRRAKSPR